MSEPLLVPHHDRLIKLRKSREPVITDKRRHISPVVGLPLAANKPTRFQPVQHPCNVRVLRYQAVADLTAAHSLAPGTPQYPQNVVLRCRKILFPKNRRDLALELFCGRDEP